MSNDLRQQFPKIEIMKDKPLRKYTFTKTGGNADWLAFPKSVEEVQALVKNCKDQKLPLTVLGNASNLIVKDGGIEGLVILTTKMADIQVSGNKVSAEAGAAYIDVTKAARDASLTGLEFAAGIPGSVGGAVFMNAGAYGGETKNILSSATVLLPSGEVKVMTNSELAFGYRHSAVQDNHGVVLSATFALQPGDQTAITAKMDDFNARRAAKQPLELPSCGSVFKRPTGYYAGKLIHDTGLQGYTVGGAQVSTKHAGFIVNIGNGTAADYQAVIKHVQDAVKAKYGVQLRREVRIIGRD